MTSEEYFNALDKVLNNKSDTEFIKLLVDSGLLNCPLDEMRDLTPEEENACMEGLESISEPVVASGLGYCDMRLPPYEEYLISPKQVEDMKRVADIIATDEEVQKTLKKVMEKYPMTEGNCYSEFDFNKKKDVFDINPYE